MLGSDSEENAIELECSEDSEEEIETASDIDSEDSWKFIAMEVEFSEQESSRDSIEEEEDASLIEEEEESGQDVSEDLEF